MTLPAKGAERGPAQPGIGAALWASAVEGFVNALVVSILGTVAVSIVGAICGDMIPSAPPVFGGKSVSGHVSAATLHHWWHSIRAHGFAIVWGLFFLHGAWVRLSAPTGTLEDPGVTGRVREILDYISKHWFSLVVRNAIGAWISAVILVWVQRFSLSRILWHMLLQPVMNGIHSIAIFMFGPSRMDTIDGMISWYGDNQFKFTFWFIYMAAICDDLGLPNVKTLGRWAWRKFKARTTVDNRGIACANCEVQIPNTETNPAAEIRPGDAGRSPGAS